MRCDAKRSLSLNFFLIDFSRANLGMHWHQARPVALMLRCTCPSSGGSPALQLFVRFLSTFPKLSVYRNLCAFSTVFFSVLLFIFVFFFCNFFWKCATCHSTNSLAVVLPVPSLPVPPSPSAQHLHTCIPFVVFHVIPLAIRHFSSCTLLNYLCFQCHFLCCTFLICVTLSRFLYLSYLLFASAFCYMSYLFFGVFFSVSVTVFFLNSM